MNGKCNRIQERERKESFPYFSTHNNKRKKKPDRQKEMTYLI